VTGTVRLRPGRLSRSCPLIPLWQSRQASKTRRTFRAVPHRVTSPLRNVCGGRQVLVHHPHPAAVRHRRLTGSRQAETLAPFKDHSNIPANHQGGLQEGPGKSETFGAHALGKAGPARLPLKARVTINRAGASSAVNSHRGTA